MAKDDRQLLLGTRRGDEAAASELWMRFAPGMLAYASAILGPRARDSAEDVVQSVFLAILRCPARRMRIIDDVPAWMLRLTRNAALNHLRTLRRDRARLTTLASETRPSQPADSPTTDDERIMSALDALPRRHREPLVLKHIAGLTFDQVAIALSINRSTAARRYRAALALLRETLGIVPDVGAVREKHV